MKEKNKQFDNDFIELARSVYIINDKRFNHTYKILEFRNTSIEEISPTSSTIPVNICNPFTISGTQIKNNRAVLNQVRQFASSPIRTVTVGSGISPDQPQPKVEVRGLAI